MKFVDVFQQSSSQGNPRCLDWRIDLVRTSGKYNVHQNMIAKWKKQVRHLVVESFAGKTQAKANNHESEVKDLHAPIGPLTVQNDFLQKTFARL